MSDVSKAYVEENGMPYCESCADELFGDPEKVGKEIIPIGEQISVNGQPLTIIGMFQHYESEQERKFRLLEKDKPQNETGPTRSRGWGGRRGNNWMFRMKNGTVLFQAARMGGKSLLAARTAIHWSSVVLPEPASPRMTSWRTAGSK